MDLSDGSGENRTQSSLHCKCCHSTRIPCPCRPLLASSSKGPQVDEPERVGISYYFQMKNISEIPKTASDHRRRRYLTNVPSLMITTNDSCELWTFHFFFWITRKAGGGGVLGHLLLNQAARDEIFCEVIFHLCIMCFLYLSHDHPVSQQRDSMSCRLTLNRVQHSETKNINTSHSSVALRFECPIADCYFERFLSKSIFTAPQAFYPRRLAQPSLTEVDSVLPLLTHDPVSQQSDSMSCKLTLNGVHHSLYELGHPLLTVFFFFKYFLSKQNSKFTTPRVPCTQ